MYVGPEMTNTFCPACVPQLHPKLEREPVVMTMQKVLHPNIVNEKMVLIKANNGKKVYIFQWIQLYCV